MSKPRLAAGPWLLASLCAPHATAQPTQHSWFKASAPNGVPIT